jgi:hypothetical protein
MSASPSRNGCAAVFLIVLGLSMLAPGGLCIVLALPDPNALVLGAPLLLLGALCIFAAVRLRRGQ